MGCWSYLLSSRREKAINVVNFCLVVIFLGCVILWTLVAVVLCCTQVLMCCCTFVCDVFSGVRQVHPRAGHGLPSNTMRRSRVSDSCHQAPVYLNPSFSPSQSINSAGFEFLIVSLAKKDYVMNPLTVTKCFFVSEVLFHEIIHLRELLFD